MITQIKKKSIISVTDRYDIRGVEELIEYKTEQFKIVSKKVSK